VTPFPARRIPGLSREMDVNLAGMEIILRLRDRVTDREARVAQLRGQRADSSNS